MPFPSPGDLPDPGIEPGSPALQAVSLPSESSGKPKDSVVLHNCLGKRTLETELLVTGKNERMQECQNEARDAKKAFTEPTHLHSFI